MALSGSPVRLLESMSRSSFEQEKSRESVRRTLEQSEEPAKLVLDAVGNFFRENVRRRSCVVLLEQLASLRPGISPAVKVEAASLARQWRLKIGEEGQNGVLEVMGFLLLLGAYDLVDEFDSGEILSALRNFGNPARRVGNDESAVVIGLNANGLANSNVGSQTLKEELDLIHMIATANNSDYEALECLCIDMNGNNLKLFLHEYLGSHDWSTELGVALKHASDPAKLVLNTLPGFLSPQPEAHKTLLKARVQTHSILLLEQLLAMSPSPSINPDIREEASKMASLTGRKLKQMYKSPVIAYGYLLFVASYRRESKYKEYDLFRLLVLANRYKANPQLCGALGFARKAEDLVRILINENEDGAVDYIHAYNLTGMFQPVRFLKDHLNFVKRGIDKRRYKLSLQQAADEEIYVIRTILEYIVKYKLESEYPKEELEKQISELENMKNLQARQDTNVPIAPVSDKNFLVDAQVTVEPSSNEDPKSDDQTKVKVEPSPKEDPKLGDQTEVKVEHPIPEKDSNLDNKALLKGEPSPKEEPKFETRAQVKGVPYRKKSSAFKNQAQVKGESDQKKSSTLEKQTQVKGEPHHKKSSTFENQAQAKGEPSPKKSPMLEKQAQEKGEPHQRKSSTPENQAQLKEELYQKKSSMSQNQAQVKGVPYWKKLSKFDDQTQVKAKLLTKKDSKSDNQAKVMAEPSLKEDPNLGNQAQVKVEPFPKEYSELNNQATKVKSSSEDKRESENRVENLSDKDSLSISTSRWPRLGSLCASIYGKGLFLLSRKDRKEVSASAYPFISPSPELKSFCANMDGRTMRVFLYDHMEDQDLLQDALREILTCVLDPAKLVFDAMPGFLDSDLEFNKCLSLDKIANSRILLLEQLSIISPEISPCLKEESQKMANEWRENLGKMHAAPSNVYGFLLFIAAYGLVSNYEVNGLLGLLLRANYHQATPSLCRMLRLQIDDVSVLIQNLKQDDLPLEAIEHVYEFELTSKFRPVRLLKYGLHARPRGATNLPSEDVIDRKLAAAKRFMVCIKKFKLEPDIPREDLEKYITELESHKVNISNANTAKFASLP